MINRICIIGVGLIGGSLSLALKKNGFCQHVIGAGRNQSRLEHALSLGVVDECELDYARAVADADLVFISVPLGAMADVFEKIRPGLKPHTIVTDGGSAKHCVIEDAREKLGTQINQFVPGHPIAGTEKSGAESAFDSLYQQRKVILTPLEENSAEAINLIRRMWQSAGAKVEIMGARHHDLVLAGTSHLPHILAYGLVDCLNNAEDVDEIFDFAAGGFRDLTRIASSDPVMWRDICLANGEALLAMMNKYQQTFDTMKDAIANEDGETLEQLFNRARQARQKFSM